MELIAPGTLLPEAFNAIWQQHRHGEMDLKEVREVFASIERVPAVFYPPEELIGRAGEITTATGAIVYDALFLALAENSNTVMVTDDGKLLRRLEGTPHERLAVHLSALRLE